MPKDNFVMRALSGKPLQSLFWGKLVIDLEGIRVKVPMPALRQHDQSRPVGVISQVWTDDTGLWGKGRFLKTSKDGQEVSALLEEGLPFQSSVGVWCDKVEELKAGETTNVNGQDLQGPAFIWRKSNVREISFVALGADADTSARKEISASALHSAGVTIKERKQMPVIQEHETVDCKIARLSGELAAREGLNFNDALDKLVRGNPALGHAYLQEASDEADGPQPAGYKGQLVDVALTDLAKKIMQRDGCDFEEASRKALAENPELHVAYKLDLNRYR